MMQINITIPTKPYLHPHMRKKYKYIKVGNEWILYRKTGSHTGSTTCNI